MCLARRLIDECARAGDPVMLKVPPATPQRVTAYGSHVIVNAKLSAGQALKEDAEPSCRDIETAGLNPDSVRIGNPRTVFVDTCIRDEVVALPPARIETVGDAVENGYRHCFPRVSSDGTRHASAPWWDLASNDPIGR